MIEEENLVQHRTGGRTWFYRFANAVGANVAASFLKKGKRIMLRTCPIRKSRLQIINMRKQRKILNKRNERK